MPLTWRNVNAPNFSGVGASLATAIRGFASAREGADIFTDQSREFVDQENEYQTNEAIADALARGSFDPSSNRRVDSGAVLDALAAQEGIESENLLQAGATQDNIRKTRENSPEFLAAEEAERKRKADLEAQNLLARQQEIQHRTRLLELTMSEQEREKRERGQIDELNTSFATARQTAINEGRSVLPLMVQNHLRETNYDLDNPADVVKLEEVKQQMQRDVDQASTVAFDSNLPEFMRQARGQYSERVIAASRPGSIASQFEQYSAATDAAQNAKRADEIKYGRGVVESIANGGAMNGMIHDGTGWRPAKTASEAKGNNLSSLTDATNWMKGTLGYDLSKGEKANLQIILDNVGGNKEAAKQAIVDSGGFEQAEKDRWLWFDDDADMNWGPAIQRSEEIGRALNTAATNYDFGDVPGEIPSLADLLTGSDRRAKNREYGEGQEEETPAESTATEGINIHPSQEGNTSLQEEIQKLGYELDNDVFIRPNNEEIPLSDFHRRSKESELKKLIDRIESPAKDSKAQLRAF